MVMLVLGVVAACLVLYGIEVIWGWPDWLTVNQIGHRRMMGLRP
jgi:hypothetical protein